MGRASRKARGHLEEAFGGAERTRVIVLLAAVLAMSSADAATVGAAANPLRKALGIDNADIGLLVTASSLVAAIASLPFGVLADRVKRTRTLGISVALWGVAMLWSATAGSFERLLISRLFLGVVTAAAGPTVASMVGDYFPAAERGRIYSYILTGELLGAGLGFAVTGDIAALSWRAAFVILALPTFVLARLLFRLPEPARGGTAPLRPQHAGPDRSAPDPPTPPPSRYDPDRFDPDNYDGPNYLGPGVNRAAGYDREQPAAGYDAGGYEDWAAGAALPPATGPAGATDDDTAATQETDAQRVARERGIEADPDLVLKSDPRKLSLWEATRYLLSIKTNLVLIVASACGYYYLAGLSTFGSEFATDQYGVPEAVANLLILVIGVGAIAGVLVGGGLSDWLLKRRYLNSRVMVAGVAALATTLLFVPALLTRSTITALPYLTLAAFALTAQNPPIDAARLDIVPPLLWGRAEGLRTLLRTLAQSMAPVLFGALSDLFGGGRSGLQWTFALMLLPLLANGIILMIALRTYPRDVATASAAVTPE